MSNAAAIAARSWHRERLIASSSSRAPARAPRIFCVIASALVATLCVTEAAAAPPTPRERALSDAVETSALNECLDHDSLVSEIGNWLERDTIDERLRIRVVGLNDTVTFTIEIAGEHQL